MFVRRDRPPAHQFKFMIGASYGLGFKLLLRYDGPELCRWDKSSF